MTRGRLIQVRWERLFDDVEAQLEAAERDEFVAEVADRGRRELAGIALTDRLRRALGLPLELTVAGAGILRGAVSGVGPDWLLVSTAGQPDVVVVAHAIRAVRGLPRHADQPGSAGEVAARLDLGYLLRVIARDRSAVSVVSLDGTCWVGTIDRVGADFIDLAEHAAGQARRAQEVTGVRTVPFAGLAVVRPG